MRIALVGGGTGGHIFPLASLHTFGQLHSQDFGTHEYVWIGEIDSLEQKVAHEHKIPFFPIHSGKLRRYFSLRTLVEPFFVFWGILEALRILSSREVDAVFSKGGYVSLPAAIAAWLLHKPVFLHESDSVPGLANRLVAYFAKTIFLTFDSAGRYFSSKKTKVVGQILNPELFSGSKEMNREKDPRTHVLVIGGSLGSTRVLEFVLEHISMLSSYHVTIVLGTLNRHFQKFFAPYEFVTTHEFLSQKDLSHLFPTVDVAITRAGATSLFELAAFGIRLIMIPLPESANNHQYLNARFFEEKGHTLVQESDFSGSAVARVRACLEQKRTRDGVDMDLVDKPLRIIFEILASYSALTHD